MVSVFLPIGPCGQVRTSNPVCYSLSDQSPIQGGYAILLIGKTLASVLPALSESAPHSSILSYPATGAVFETVAVTFAFGLWAIGTWWATIAAIGG
jgi:Voltage-dependent anion channel